MHDCEPPKGFVSKRAKALALTFGAVIFLSAVVFLVAVLPPLLSDAGLGSGGRIALGILRWPILGIVMAIGVGLLYRLAVPEHAAGFLGFVTLGTVVALLGWLVVSAGFAFYTANFARYSKTYGTLASIVVVLLWLWLSSLLVLVGAEVRRGADRGRCVGGLSARPCGHPSAMKRSQEPTTAQRLLWKGGAFGRGNRQATFADAVARSVTAKARETHAARGNRSSPAKGNTQFLLWKSGFIAREGRVCRGPV